jgi:hypothetical protein
MKIIQIYIKDTVITHSLCQKKHHLYWQMKGSIWSSKQNCEVSCPFALTEHHAMKIYWGSVDISPRIFYLGTVGKNLNDLFCNQEKFKHWSMFLT